MSLKAEENLTEEQVRPGLNYIIKDGVASQAMGILNGGTFRRGPRTGANAFFYRGS